MGAKIKEEKPRGAPAYMVSFGDMMTLILCFFILLVAMAKERNYGLLAAGVGSFIVAIESHGLNGIMSAQEKQGIFNQVRRRFNLPPSDELVEGSEATNLELVRAELAKALEPKRELSQPRVAAFDDGSFALTVLSRNYLDRLADSLRPAKGQLLVLEGHASDSGRGAASDPRWLAFSRAEEVRRYLIDEHGYPSDRVEARAWLREDTQNARRVDARLIAPRE